MLLLLVTTTTVTSTLAQTTQSTLPQDSSHSNGTRGSSPPTDTCWAKAYGGSGDDNAYSIGETPDKGFIVAGNTWLSVDSSFDTWVLKLNSSGSVVWQKTYGGSQDDGACCIQQTSDGGYVVAGHTYSFGAGSDDVWILKLNSSGSVEWQKSYGGGDGWDRAYSLQQTSDGGYMVAGSTGSFGAGYVDVWVLKLDSNGSVVWQKAYGGSDLDCAYSVQQTSDGGCIVAGGTNSTGAGGCDLWVLKLDSDGSVVWQKAYGGSDYDQANSVQQTSDGGYMVAGGTLSFGAGSGDVWVLKLDSDGSVVWQKAYGDSSIDWANSVQHTSDGGYMVAGSTYSSGTGTDLWVLKLNSDGSVDWQKAYGGSDYDDAYSLQQTSDGGYIFAGGTRSFGAGGCDLWVLKMDSSGSVEWNGSSGAMTWTTSVTPSNTNAVVTTTSANPANSTATVQKTQATPQVSHATVTVQSSGGGTTTTTTNGDGGGAGQEIPMIIIAGVAVSVVIVILVTIVMMKKKTSPTRTVTTQEVSHARWSLRFHPYHCFFLP
jgi:uncharacterized delta-60 repeat protein